MAKKPVSFKLIGGKLCLDFANTVDWRKRPEPGEKLTTCAELLRWSAQAGILDASELQERLRHVRRHPADAGRALKRAIALREAIYALVVALRRKRRPEEADLAVLNDTLAAAATHLRLRPAGSGMKWRWEAEPDEMLSLPLWVIARSAAELMASPELKRVGQCADDRGCGWLFFDASRNHTRRWCDIRDCGNRAKARRHYARAHSL